MEKRALHDAISFFFFFGEIHDDISYTKKINFHKINNGINILSFKQYYYVKIGR